MPAMQFRITNINCDACVKLSESVLSDIPGVVKIVIDPKNGNAQVDSENEISFNEIKQALAEVDKTAEMLP